MFLILNFKKIRPVKEAVIHADRWTNGQKETDGRSDKTEQIGASRDYVNAKAPTTRIDLLASVRLAALLACLKLLKTSQFK